MNLGLPPLSRPWSLAELAKAGQVLSTMADADPTHLPRFGSKRSGDVFARLVRPDAMTKAKDPSSSPRERAIESFKLVKVIDPVFKSYLGAFSKGAVAGADFVEIMGLVLRSCVAAIGPLVEAAAILDKRDPLYEERMSGFTQAKKGLGEIAEAALITLPDREHLQTEDVRRLLGYLYDTLPPLFVNMNADGQRATLNRLNMLVRTPAMRDFAQNLSVLRSKVMSSLAAASHSPM
jgi:hypothetical protein